MVIAGAHIWAPGYSNDLKSTYLGLCPSDIGEEDFLLHLEQDPGFTNPHCVENLKSVLGISCSLQPSLLKEIQL